MAKIVNNLDQTRIMSQRSTRTIANGHAAPANNATTVHSQPALECSTTSNLPTSNAEPVSTRHKTGVVSRKMGSVVSRLNAVFFGSRLSKSDSSTEETLHSVSTSKGVSLQTDINRPTRYDPEASAGKQDHHSSQSDLEYKTARGSTSSCDTPTTCDTPTLLICNELADNTFENTVTASENHEHSDNEIIEVSDDEVSADDEQTDDAADSNDESEAEIERVESDAENCQGNETEEYANYNSDDEEVVVDDESEVEEHECDSTCDHSEYEDYNEEESEDNQSIDDEGEPNDDNSEHADDHVQFTDSSGEENEEEADEYESEASEMIECGSNCPSDCDGDHHECSSECECQFAHSDSEHDVEEGHYSSDDALSPLRENCPPIPPPLPNGTEHLPLRYGSHQRQGSLPQTANELINQTSNLNKLRSNEHNNNKLRSTNSVDIMGELKTAIDARVRRSASCKEVPMYRKLSNSSIGDQQEVSHASKLDTKERELHRKDRRARLRTLELKREKYLTEVRDGTKSNMTDSMYDDTVET